MQPRPGETTRRRIVVVEDDEDLLRMLRVMLRSLGEVHAAMNGVEAVEVLDSLPRPPDVIVTDIMMPEMDGLALAKKLKNDASTHDVPIVFLTAKGAPRDVIKGINAGARHYVTKPFKQAELLEKVKKAIGDKK